MAEIREARLSVKYDGRDISQEINQYITGFSYTDHMGGKADDLQITVEDRQGLWSGSWYPTKGAILAVKIHSNLSGKETALKCGTFAIDEITPQGPPDTVTIKAVSSLTAKDFKRVKKSKAWENITLQTITKEIAAAHDLGVFFLADESPQYIRLDQKEESDLAFLNRLCRENDLSLKLSDEKIIVFQGRKFEQADPVRALVKGETVFSRYGFSSKTFDVYKACELSYMDPETKEVKVYTYTPPDAPDVGQVLKVNRRVESLAQAQKVAMGSLRRKNQHEITGNLSMMGDTIMLAGLTHTVAGFGVFDGKYIMDEANHAYTKAGGYLTAIKSRKVLTW